MPNPKKTGKDKDELLQEQHDLIPGESKEQDMDDLVHQQPPAPTVNELEETDPDELVHQIPSTLRVDETKEVDVDDLLHQADEGEE